MTETVPARAPVPGRIVCLYDVIRSDEIAAAMDHIRFRRMAEALARRGHQVDMLMDVSAPLHVSPRLRHIPYRGVDWDAYDMVKTLFHVGFDHLVEWGGGDHPFIVSKLGSVVGSGPTPGSAPATCGSSSPPSSGSRRPAGTSRS